MNAKQLFDLVTEIKVASAVAHPCPCCNRMIAPIGKKKAWIHVGAEE